MILMLQLVLLQQLPVPLLPWLPLLGVIILRLLAWQSDKKKVEQNESGEYKSCRLVLTGGCDIFAVTVSLADVGAAFFLAACSCCCCDARVIRFSLLLVFFQCRCVACGFFVVPGWE